MRADRLLKLILVLSDGRRRTAAQLADQLEVSERTIYRDVDALVELGAPVIATRGPDGGIALAPTWRRVPTLPLTPTEVAGLAALTVPAALGSLEEPLRDALAKVLAALPTSQRAHAELARERLLVTSSSWWGSGEGPLDRVLDAVWQDRRVALAYRDADGRETERHADALAVVVQGERWYLVADTAAGRRVFRGDRIRSVDVLADRFTRPELDLRAFWAEHVRAFVQSRPSFPVTLRLTARGRRRLAEVRPAEERAAIEAGGDVVVDFHREDIALAQIVALGPEVRVLGPPSFRDHLAAIARAWLG